MKLINRDNNMHNEIKFLIGCSLTLYEKLIKINF